MKTVEAIGTLCDLDRDGRAVFSLAELRNIFPERSDHTFTAGLRRLTAQGILKRADTASRQRLTFAKRHLVLCSCHTGI